MENSSKALLISGTVLIVILLISVGMKLFNSTSDLSDQVNLSSQSTAASNFNAQFTTYFSNSAPGYKAKALVSKLMEHNVKVSSAPTFSPENHQVHLNLYSSPGNLEYRSQMGYSWITTNICEHF